MLNVTIYQQINDYTCGPAALLTAISHFKDIPANLTEQALLDKLETTPEKGTPNEKMIAVAKDLGFYSDSGTGGSLKLLKEQMGHGRPVIVAYNDSEQSFHFAVVVHVNDKVVVLADPWTKQSLLYYPDEFMDDWVDSEGVKGWWLAIAPQNLKQKVEQKYFVLAANQTQLEHAKNGIEGIGFYDIPIQDFLDLTTENDQQAQSILQETKNKQPKTDWETSIIHPFIYVDENGKIDGHEGRHRAASAFHQGHKRFRIVIAARDGGWSHKKWGWRWKRQLPVPPVLRGQFRPVTHKVDMSHYEEIKR